MHLPYLFRQTGDAGPAPPVRGPAPQPLVIRAPVCRASGIPRRTRRKLHAVVCDIDDVLLRFNPEVAAAIERRHHLPQGRLLDVLTSWPTAQLASVGAVSYARWLSWVSQSLPPAAVDQWLGYHGALDQQVADLLAEAGSAGLRVLLLGNGTPRVHHDLAHHGLGWHGQQIAQRLHVSYQIGYAKPDPAAFLHLLHSAGLTPARTLLVDDSYECVHAARELGMRAHHYRSPAEMRRELARSGATR